MQVKKSDKLL